MLNKLTNNSTTLLNLQQDGLLLLFPLVRDLTSSIHRGVNFIRYSLINHEELSSRHEIGKAAGLGSSRQVPRGDRVTPPTISHGNLVV